MARCFILIAALAATPAAATDLAALDRLVEAFAGAPMGAEGGPVQPIDKRLRLAACKGAPLLDWYGNRRDAITVSCPDAGGWRLFVPVRGAAQAAVGAAPKAEPVIRRGDLVTLIAGKGSFSVSQSGTAMRDAALGERLMLRVDGVKNPVQAVAVDVGQATLPGWDSK